MGGVGKTALALVLAEQLTEGYPDAQFYLDLKGTSDKPLVAAEAMAHVIRGYRLDYKPPENQAELAVHYHSVLHGQRAILLVDNARGAAQVTPLLPPTGCLLLVTSRWHFTLPGLHAKNLDTLPPEDARKLLLAIAPRTDGQAGEIARLCGFLPLALRLAGSAVASHPDLAPAEYARRLTDAQKRLELVDASLALSYELLSPELQRRFAKLAVFPESFERLGAAAVWEMELDPAREALSELVSYSLLEWNEPVRRYRLHDLVRDFAHARLTSGERAEAERRHAALYVGVARAANDFYLKGGENVTRGLALFDAEWANIQAGQAWAAAHAPQSDDAARLCSAYPNAGAYCSALRQHPRDQIRWLEAALAAARRVRDRGAEGSHLGNLGVAYRQLGEARRAIEFYEQRLAIAREIGDRRGEGAALGNLGIAYAALGEARRAIGYHEQALTILRELGDRRAEGSVLGNLGNAYRELGETRRAIEFHQKALEIDRKIGDRRGEGQDLGNLGNAYLALGETRRAIEFYEKCVLIHREIGDRQGEGNDLGNLGLAYADLGEARRAIEFYEKALEIDREVGDRRGEGIDLLNMGLALEMLGERAQAIAHAQAALKILVEIEDPDATRVRKKLADWGRT
jgi:tetratricopeptide (TPR) repeat protein